MLSEKGLSLLKSLLTYDPKNRASCESAMRAEYFREDPRPIDPSMFPTWPAKSEQEPGDKGFLFISYLAAEKYLREKEQLLSLYLKQCLGSN